MAEEAYFSNALMPTHPLTRRPPSLGRRKKAPPVLRLRGFFHGGSKPPDGSACCLTASTCFNPRPSWLAGESRTAPSTTLFLMFQSTPTITGGRIQTPYRADRHGDWFQSTPAIAGGRIKQGFKVVGFILQFQSTPAIAGGRIPCLCSAMAVQSAFQSTPASDAQGLALIMFQSTPAIAGGRIDKSHHRSPTN